MINQNFYQQDKAVKMYLGGKVPHYLRRSFTTVLEKYPYPIGQFETMYSLGLKVFGDTSQYFWTIIAECNHIKMPDQWVSGQIVYLPSIILNDPETRSADYESATSLTTAI